MKKILLTIALFSATTQTYCSLSALASKLISNPIKVGFFIDPVKASCIYFENSKKIANYNLAEEWCKEKLREANIGRAGGDKINIFTCQAVPMTGFHPSVQPVELSRNNLPLLFTVIGIGINLIRNRAKEDTKES
jgi:hypothetical protein